MIKINLKIEKKDLWLLSAIMVFLIGVGYVVAYGGSQPPAVMGHSINEIERCAEGKILKVSGGLWICSDDNDSYCYTYYSTLTTSCDCPSGETNEKDLGSWGYCNNAFDFSGDRDLFRPPGLSCADISPVRFYYSVDRGLACVCCEG